MTILPFQSLFPNDNNIEDYQSYFATVGNKVKLFRQNTQLPSSKASIYIYQISRIDSKKNGLVCLTPIEDFRNGKILGHEKTIVEKELVTLQNFETFEAIVKPILISYPSVNKIETFISNYSDSNLPLFSIEIQAISEVHTVWAIEDKNLITAISDLFIENVATAYIADGHHRVATAHKHYSGKISGILSAFFGFEHLEILDYNRVVDIASTEPETVLNLLHRLGSLLKLSHYEKPKKAHQLILFIGDMWYEFKWSSDLLNSQKSIIECLDVSLVNNYIFNQILGIKDSRNAETISYISGIQDIEQEVSERSKKANIMYIGFYPILEEEIMKIADDGEYLPPKSTWFEPRMKNGLFSQQIK